MLPRADRGRTRKGQQACEPKGTSHTSPPGPVHTHHDSDLLGRRFYLLLAVTPPFKHYKTRTTNSAPHPTPALPPCRQGFLSAERRWIAKKGELKTRSAALQATIKGNTGTKDTPKREPAPGRCPLNLPSNTGERVSELWGSSRPAGGPGSGSGPRTGLGWPCDSRQVTVPF